jgi:hypothetical protein
LAFSTLSEAWTTFFIISVPKSPADGALGGLARVGRPEQVAHLARRLRLALKGHDDHRARAHEGFSISGIEGQLAATWA